MFNFSARAILVNLAFLSILFTISLPLNAQVVNWSTYLNTTGTDNVNSMVKDNAGDIYITGNTNANGYPVTPGAFQNGLGNATSKITLSKISGATGQVIWSTYLGGDNDKISYTNVYWDEASNSININAITSSNTYPVINGRPKSSGAVYSPVFTQFSAASGTVLFSTYLYPVATIQQGSGVLDFRVLYDNGRGYFVSLEAGYKKILISCINLSTHQFVYEQTLGGTQGEINHIAGISSLKFVIDNDELLLTGATSQPDFPTTAGVFQPVYPAGAYQAYFITKFTAGGSIGFSSFAGSVDFNYPIFVPVIATRGNEIAFAGSFHEGIPVSPGGIAFSNEENTNLGVFKFNKSTGSLQYFTYLGGNTDFFPFRTLSYVNDQLILSGNSQTAYLPVTANALQKQNSYYEYDGVYGGDCFILQLDASNNIVYCSYMGGTKSESFQDAKVVGNDVYFTGTTASLNFPVTANATQSVNKGFYGSSAGELVLVKYNTISRSVTYSSFLGTNLHDSYMQAISVNGDHLYINAMATGTGNTPLTADFPVTPDALQKTMVLGTVGASHQYVAKINTVTGRLEYGSYIGSLPAGKGENIAAMLVDQDDIYVAAMSVSNDYPVTPGAVQTQYLGERDMVLTKLSLCHTPIINNIITPLLQNVCINGNVDTIKGQIPQQGNVPDILRNGQPESQANFTNFTYQWQKSTDNINWETISGAIEINYQPSPVAIKTYFRRIAKPMYCSNTDTSDVAVVDLNGLTTQLPDVGGDGNFFTCKENSIGIGTAPVPGTTYSWEPAAGLSTVSQSQTTFSNPVSGAYTYVLTATGSNGCTGKDTATIFNYAANAGEDKILCEGRSTQIGGPALAGLAGVIYSWSPAAGLSCTGCAQPVVSAAGTYILTVTLPLAAGGNCVTKDTVLVGANTIGANPAGPDITVCNASPATLGTARVPGYVYNWTPGIFLSGVADVNQPVFNGLNATLELLYNPVQYVLTASNPAGCSVTDTVKVYVVNPFAGYGGCRPLQLGRKDRTGGQATYQWVEVVNGVENPVQPGELSSTTIPNPVALANPAITENKRYRLNMTWNGVTCASDVNVGVNCGCPPIKVKFISPSGCPNASSSDSLTMYIDNPSPEYHYTWSPPDGLNTTEGPVVKTGVTTSTVYTVRATNIADPNMYCEEEFKVNLFANNAPSFAAPDLVICRNTQKNIGLPAVGGLEYSWTSSESMGAVLFTEANPAVFGDKNISYYVTVTDPVTGCFTNDTVKVTVPDITAVPGPSRFSCPGGTFVIGSPAQPGFTYRWVPTSGLDNPNIAQPTVLPGNTNTVFVLIVTDPVSGCTAVDALGITYSENPVLDPITAPPAYCAGSNTSVQIGNDSLSNVTYSWSPATGLSNPLTAKPIASPLTTTTYTVTATFNGTCTSTATQTVTVTVNPRPTATASINSNCVNAQLDVATNATTPLFSWSPADGLDQPSAQNPVSTATVPLNYSVLVTDLATGCTNVSSVNFVPPVPVDAGADKFVCEGSSTMLGTPALPGVIYSWSPSTGLSNPNIAQPSTLTTLTPGEYTYQVSATGNGCTKTDLVKITVRAKPGLSLTNDISICKNASVQIGTSPVAGVSYSWSPATGLSDPNVANPVASPQATTTYTLTATDVITGCSMAASTTVTVNLTGAPVLSAANVSDCPGNAVQLNAVVNSAGTFNYVWTPDIYFNSSRFIADPIVSPPVTTTYQVQVTNTANGCASTALATVTIKDSCKLLPVRWLAFNAWLQNDQTKLQWTVAMEENNAFFAVERSTNGIQWNTILTKPSLGNTAMERTYHAIDPLPSAVNYYRIKQVDLDGAFTYSVVRMVRKQSVNPSFIVYPNPVHGTLYYELMNTTGFEGAEFQLLAADGRIVKKINITTTVGSINLSGLAAGVYIVRKRDRKTGVTENLRIVVQ